MKLFATLSLSLSLFVVAACGGKSSGGGTTAEAGPTCAEMAANLTSLMRATMPELGDDVMAQANDITATSCTEDAWSPEAIKCYAEATSAEKGTCEGVLTAEQQQTYGERLAPVFMAAETPGGEEGGVEGGEEGGGEEGGDFEE